MKRILLASFWIACSAPAWADEFYHDFRKGPLPPELALFQAKKEGVVKLEPEGLRITIRKDWQHPYGGVGVTTTFSIHGDFEITTTYEILEAEPPPKGYGVGVSLRIHKSPTELANLSRLVRAGDREIVLWNRALEVDGKVKYPEGQKPCADTIGRLRLKRTGETLYWLWAAGTMGDEFQELHQVDFGADEIKRVLLIGLTGRESADVDVLFHDLRIQSGALKPAGATVRGETATPVGTSSDQGSRFWWLAIAALVGGVVVILALAARRRRGTVGDGGAIAVSGPGGEYADVACPHCHKRLKVPAHLTGKKVKCPACGTGVAVC